MKRFLIVLILLFTGICFAAEDAKQIDFLLSGYRNPTTDEVLSGGKVYTYLDGTSTLSALWTDKDKGVTAANPVILDSTGRAEVYGDNIYKFVIYDSDDVLIETINGLEYKTATAIADQASDSIVSDSAFDSTTWNGVTTIAPSKNAVRDRIVLEAKETLTNQGDLLTASSSKVLARLAIGLANEKLFVNTGATGYEFGNGINLISGTRDQSLANGNLSLTGAGFKPSGVALLSIDADTAEVSIGFAVSGTEFCVYNRHDAVADTWSNDTNISVLLDGSGVSVTASLSSFDADGITLAITKAGSPTGTSNYYALVWR